jgi:hypothetical protein
MVSIPKRITLRVFENGMVNSIFGPQREEMLGR